MSASELQANESCKDTGMRKIGQSGLRIRIRLPRKRLSDGTQKVSKGVAEDSDNLTEKNVPAQTDENTQSTICSATEVKAEVVSSNLPGVPEDAKNVSAKEVPKQTDNNTRSTFSMASKLMVEEVNSNCPGEELCKEAGSNIENKTLSRDTLPEKVDFFAASRNPATASVVQGEEESNFHVTLRLCGEGNKNILDKEVSPENSCSTRVEKSCTGVTGKSKTLTVPCEDASNNVLSNRLCDRNRNTSSKGISGKATINCLSKNPTFSALKGKEANDNPVRSSLFEARNRKITGKLSEVQNNAQSRRPVAPANEKTSKKRLHTSAVHSADTCKNTSGKKHVPSAVQAAEQSSSAANLEAIKVYKEFEEKVRRTVYLDNLSHLATQTVIKVALNQFGTVRNINFIINYTVPYDIPQSALVEMESEKDADSVISMLHEFPFMISGMPRPVRAQRATSVMFNDRPRRPGGKLEFCWVGPSDPDYQNVRKFKLMSKRHEVENLALIKLELEGEKLLANQQQDDLNCNYRKLETVDTVLTTGWVDRLSHIYNMRFNEAF